MTSKANAESTEEPARVETVEEFKLRIAAIAGDKREHIAGGHPRTRCWFAPRSARTTRKQNVEPPASAGVENTVESVYPRQCQMNLGHLKSISLMRLI